MLRWEPFLWLGWAGSLSRLDRQERGLGQWGYPLYGKAAMRVCDLRSGTVALGGTGMAVAILYPPERSNRCHVSRGAFGAS